MSLPLELIFVRHGESEYNLASKRAKKGDRSDFEGEFAQRHGSKWRLTDKGREQALTAGQWLRNDPFLNGAITHLRDGDGYYVSPALRSRETAGLLGLEHALWRIEPHLRERDYGDTNSIDMPDAFAFKDHNPYYGAPPDGESLITVGERVRHLLYTLAREFAQKRVIVVCHGEFMWAARLVLEKMYEEDFLELNASENPHDHIWNCQILHYSRNTLPNGTPVLAEQYTSVRSVCPSDLSKSSNDWKPIVRKKFTNEQLLAEVEKYPLLVPR